MGTSNFLHKLLNNVFCMSRSRSVDDLDYRHGGIVHEKIEELGIEDFLIEYLYYFAAMWLGLRERIAEPIRGILHV